MKRLSTIRTAAWLAAVVAFYVSLAVAPAANGPDLGKVLSGIELRYNSLATLQSEFEQTMSYAGRPRRSERGLLYLRRPKMMLWRYSDPEGKIAVGDGEILHQYNPLTNQVRQVKMDETGDMRAPLAFLLGRLRFRRLFRNLRIEERDGKSVLIGDGRSGKEAYKDVEFSYDPKDFRLLHIAVNGADGTVTSFRFANEKVNLTLDEAMFAFKPPAGAEVLNDFDTGGAQ
jgi:outer membrane lipoprotein carrier protein